MPPRILGVVAAALVALIVVSRAQRADEASATVVNAEVDAPVIASTAGSGSVSRGPDSIGTPSIDLLARLAIRRRLERDRGRVYLDSLLLQTDSTLVRWPDRPDKTIRVALVADTTVPGFTRALLDHARAGMAAWQSNEAGLVLRETDDALTADIRVEWVAVLPDSAQLGLTELSWEGNGAVNTARIQLAIRTNPDSQVVPANIARRVAAHEFGHAIGLPHSAVDTDLMFPSSPVAVPSRRDQATLLLLYAVPSGPLKDP
jgi:hypothetical protein